MLSALAHGGRPDNKPIFDALVTALEAFHEDLANLYADVVLAALPKHARLDLEKYMSIAADRYQSDFARRYFTQGETVGEARGEARAVLAIFEARGIDVSASARERITACTDLDMLERWIRRAMTVNTADGLFQD